MGERAYETQSRFYLEAAKYYYKKMEANLSDRVKFTFSLLAFLPIARSVTLIFQKEFNDDSRLMTWYHNEAKEWENNKTMRFFKNIRNISLKEHTPEIETIAGVTFKADVILGVKHLQKIIDSLERTQDSGGGEHWATPVIPLEVENRKILGYNFLHYFKWFDEDPDVMYLCKEYLDELERFVSEVENKIERNKP